MPHRDATTPPGLSPPLAAPAIASAAAAAYANSFRGLFLFDDSRQIVDKPAIRSLAAVWSRRRPVVDFTLALNHRLGGLEVWGYHLVNLLIHVLAGLVLYGLIRRTLRLPAVPSRCRRRAAPLAFAAALLWVLHPLQTESVTYVIQRAESLMGLFYLLTLYTVLRGVTAPRGRGRWWFVLSVLACGLGMGAKAVCLTAPILVLLYDRVFLAPSLAAILKRRGALYLGLAATWSVLLATGVAAAVLDTAPANRSVGFGYHGLTPLAYAASQPGVIVHYLRLALWPWPLCLDYGWPAAHTARAIVAPGLVLAALLAATGFALRRWPGLGFLGAGFFLVLAPTSSVVPIKDIAFEHRMYLPLAAVLVLLVLAVTEGLDLAVRRRALSPPGARRAAVALLLTAAVLAAFGTLRRNRDYGDKLRMWTQTVGLRPDNPRALASFATALVKQGQVEASLESFEKALRINPQLLQAHVNFANALTKLGRRDEAIEHYRLALRFRRNRDVTHFNLALLLGEEGRSDEAIDHFRQALALDPGNARAHHLLGNLLVGRGELDDGVEQLRAFVRLWPGNSAGHSDLGAALVRQKKLEEAEAELQTAVRLDPSNVVARNNLAGVYMTRGDLQQAIEEQVEVVQRSPNYPQAVRNLALAIARTGAIEATIDRYRDRAGLDRAHALAWVYTGDRLRRGRRLADAAAAYRRALAIAPDLPEARRGLAAIGSGPGGGQSP